jgi:hypothetical protein
MTAPPDQATAGWSRSQRPWIRSVPTQDSDRGCSEWAVQQTRRAGGIAHIQACAAWARHGCFGSRGCSRLAMPSPRLQKSPRPCGRGRPVIHDLCARHNRRPPADDRQLARSRFPSGRPAMLRCGLLLRDSASRSVGPAGAPWRSRKSGVHQSSSPVLACIIGALLVPLWGVKHLPW